MPDGLHLQFQPSFQIEPRYRLRLLLPQNKFSLRTDRKGCVFRSGKLKNLLEDSTGIEQRVFNAPRPNSTRLLYRQLWAPIASPPDRTHAP